MTRNDQLDQDRGVIRTTAKARTAVVVVHGMGSQKPRETVNGFIRTALKPFNGGRIDDSRPDEIRAPTKRAGSWRSNGS